MKSLVKKILWIGLVGLNMLTLSTAEASPCLKLPAHLAKAIVEASQAITPARGPAYNVDGFVSCRRLTTQGDSQLTDCDVNLSRYVTMPLGDSDSIDLVDLIQKEEQDQTKSNYYFSGPFKALSISREAPPYVVEDSAVLALRKDADCQL